MQTGGAGIAQSVGKLAIFQASPQAEPMKQGAAPARYERETCWKVILAIPALPAAPHAPVPTPLPPLATPLRDLLPPDADRALLIGRAWLRYWPFDHFGVLATPTYAAPSESPATP